MPIQTAIDSIGNSQGSPFGFKNRIINGGMVIDQRNAGASINGNNQTFGADRWVNGTSQSSKFTVQQQSAVVPTGFSNALKVTSSSAYTPVTNDELEVSQRIEGYNIADLAWGTANAKTVTLSFWVYSSLTGTFGGVIINSDGSRIYPYSYTISAANTWEYKTVTIPGDTTGTWLTTNGIGLQIMFSVGVASNLAGTAGVWGTYGYRGVTGQVNIVATNGATWYITGVQLEKGTQATPFDYRDYGRELAMCQRYYVQSNSAGSGAQFMDITGRFTGTTQATYTIALPVTMRSQPAVSISPAYNFSGVGGASWYANLAGITNYAWTSAPTASTSFLLNNLTFYVSCSTITSTYVGLWTDPYCPTTASANYFAITAEL